MRRKVLRIWGGGKVQNIGGGGGGQVGQTFR